MMQYIDTTHNGITYSTAFTVVDGDVTFERVMLCQHDLFSADHLSNYLLDAIEAEIYKQMENKGERYDG